MKLIKIRFTSWRDTAATPRSLVFQEQLDAWTARLSALSAAAARIKDEQAYTDSEVLQSSLARVTADLEKIAAERTMLLSVEKRAAEAEVRTAREHRKAGTFGYQVFNDAGTRVTKIVDEFGNDPPAKAVYSYEVVDDDPSLPEWAKRSGAKRQGPPKD